MDAIYTPAPEFSVCIYCASRHGTHPVYARTAQEIGAWIGRNKGQLVYGGGRAGLMGVLADAALAAGAKVVGVIPRKLVEREHAHRGCTELLVVEDMPERKRLMAERADFFVALPGGIGTLEEFFETWSWRQLGYHDKPIGLLNTEGCYDELIGFMHRCIEGGLMSDEQMQSIEIGTDWQALFQTLLEKSQSALAGSGAALGRS